MGKLVPELILRHYIQTPEQNQVSPPSIHEQQNKTDFCLRTCGLTGHLLEATPHNTPPDHAHIALPQLGITPEQLLHKSSPEKKCTIQNRAEV